MLPVTSTLAIVLLASTVFSVPISNTHTAPSSGDANTLQTRDWDQAELDKRWLGFFSSTAQTIRRVATSVNGVATSARLGFANGLQAGINEGVKAGVHNVVKNAVKGTAQKAATTSLQKVLTSQKVINALRKARVEGTRGRRRGVQRDLEGLEDDEILARELLGNEVERRMGAREFEHLDMLD
ncbi:hypothetical protein DACRYDRAFT_110157 [Dacryopinax primogenitus]|uniref:Uncharacterized protein n=1 Tax=Dacryopinax primogenitus (strain DJM 731) TaxID=1858805 RepID=M5FQY8_DACPD|nr:uncharacterized protein DACRYDRAFT_110157 [Dacryopinax primogenitus]EJT99435.1 hypothetical protein DACRYDRAFT_110157 [Dacryopinax primogenitus]